MPALSTIPVAVQFLLGVFQSSPLLGQASPPVDIINGPSTDVQGNAIPGQTSSDRAIWVGWSKDPTESGIEIQTSPPSLGGQRDREQYVIHCMAAFINTDSSIGNMSTAQATALSVYAAAREIITLNRNLGGIQGIAKINRGAVTSKQTGTGARVEVEFDVEVDAFQTYQP